MQFGFIQLYSAIRNILHLDSTLPTVRCNQIQTFAVIDEWQIASREQLEKTVIEKYKPFFYSKNGIKKVIHPVTCHLNIHYLQLSHNHKILKVSPAVNVATQ